MLPFRMQDKPVLLQPGSDQKSRLQELTEKLAKESVHSVLAQPYKILNAVP